MVTADEFMLLIGQVSLNLTLSVGLSVSECSNYYWSYLAIADCSHGSESWRENGNKEISAIMDSKAAKVVQIDAYPNSLCHIPGQEKPLKFLMSS